MKSVPKLNGGAVRPDNRHSRIVDGIASRITLHHSGRTYRGYFTVVGKILVVTCGSVSMNVEVVFADPEPQARQALLELVKTGKLKQFALPG